MKKLVLFALLTLFAYAANAQKHTYIYPKGNYLECRQDSPYQKIILLPKSTYMVKSDKYDSTRIRISLLDSKTDYGFTFSIGDLAYPTGYTSTQTLVRYLGLLLNNTGGVTYTHSCAANTDSTLIYTGACVVTHMTLINSSGTIKYVKLYDTAGVPKRASFTGAATARPQTYAIPANSTVSVPIANGGIPFSNGLAIRYLGATAYYDNENSHTAATEVPGLNDIHVNITYKY